MLSFNVIDTQTRKEGNQMIITKTTEERVGELEVQQKIQQLEYQQFDIRRNMQALKKKYDDIGSELELQRDMLQLLKEELPDIGE